MKMRSGTVPNIETVKVTFTVKSVLGMLIYNMTASTASQRTFSRTWKNDKSVFKIKIYDKNNVCNITDT